MNPNQSEELRELLAKKLEGILGQNYVDEYSGGDRHISTDEIAEELLALFQDRLKRAEVSAKIAELKHVDRHTRYYPYGSEPIEAQTRLAQLNQSLEEER